MARTRACIAVPGSNFQAFLASAALTSPPQQTNVPFASTMSLMMFGSRSASIASARRAFARSCSGAYPRARSAGPSTAGTFTVTWPAKQMFDFGMPNVCYVYRQLMACVRCKIAYYCGPVCQKRALAGRPQARLCHASLTLEHVIKVKNKE